MLTPSITRALGGLEQALSGSQGLGGAQGALAKSATGLLEGSGPEKDALALTPSFSKVMGSLEQALTGPQGLAGAQGAAAKTAAGLREMPGSTYVEGSGAAEASQTFSSALSHLIENVETTQEQADEKVKSLLTGGDVPLHQVMLATEKASISFQMLMSVRNRLLEAYQEMMRLQV